MFFRVVVGVSVLATSIVLSCASAPAPAPKKSAAADRARELVSGSNPASAAPAAAPSGTPAQKAAEAAVQSAATPPAAYAGAASAETAASAGPEMSEREKQFFDSYLKRLKYLIVVKQGVPLDDFQARSVVTKGNEYLLRQGFDVVNYDQMMKNMEDQRSAYEAEAGQSMSLVQYIAQKLGADVYVELDAVPRAWSENGRHFGEANFSANMYDPSTSELLASVTFKTDRSLSNSSPQDALLNALVAGTAQFMPRIVRDSTALLRNRYSNGIRFQLIIQRTPDSRAIALFRRNLRSRVREIQSGPAASDQSVMDVYLFGTVGDLEDACYSAFEKTPGMENTYWVYTRGKTITFNTGN